MAMATNTVVQENNHAKDAKGRACQAEPDQDCGCVMKKDQQTQ